MTRRWARPRLVGDERSVLHFGNFSGRAEVDGNLDALETNRYQSTENIPSTVDTQSMHGLPTVVAFRPLPNNQPHLAYIHLFLCTCILPSMALTGVLSTHLRLAFVGTLSP